MHNKIWMLLVAVFALAPVVGCDKKEEKKEDKDKKDDDDDKGKKKKKKGDDDDDDKDKKKKKGDDDDDDKDKKKKKGDDDDKKKDDGDKKKIGIKACDEYLDKMEKCSEKTKLGADTAKTLKTSADSTRKAWLTAADGPGKSTLETSCKTMLESSAKSYKSVCPGVFDE